MRTALLSSIAVLLAAAAAQAQGVIHLAPETNQAFEQYVAGVEPKLLEQGRSNGPLPWLGSEALARVKKGELVFRGYTGKNGNGVPEGMINDWAGAVFIPGATVAKTVSVLQDFARHKHWYPEIIESGLVSRDGNDTVGRWTLLKKKILTVVLRAQLHSRYSEVAPGHGELVTRTGPIIEVVNQGTPKQADLPAGQGHGFLWRFNAYWNLHQSHGGVYAECRVISLSRDVPTGLGWIVTPFIRSMSRESLESTLTHTKSAVAE